MNNIEKLEGSKKEILLSLLNELSVLIDQSKTANDLSPRGSSLHNNGAIEIFVNSARKFLEDNADSEINVDAYIDSANGYINQLKSEIHRLRESSSGDSNDGPMFEGIY